MAMTPNKTFGTISVVLVNDNIAARKADVLVNAANDQLQMGGGVAAALRSRGGIEIHQEAIRHAPARIGSVVRTGAGALDARYVYHAVVIDYEIRKGTSAVDVSEVVRTMVRMAVEDNARSIACPLFGAGVGGLSAEVSLTSPGAGGSRRGDCGTTGCRDRGPGFDGVRPGVGSLPGLRRQGEP